jgi:hypothetical protein
MSVREELLEQQVAQLRSALRELVELKDLKDLLALWTLPARKQLEGEEHYAQRKPEAWKNARNVLDMT